mgnify:CR=1 FL=1
MIHRDIKPENILVHKSSAASVSDISDLEGDIDGTTQFKIGDFGSAVKLSSA